MNGPARCETRFQFLLINASRKIFHKIFQDTSRSLRTESSPVEHMAFFFQFVMKLGSVNVGDSAGSGAVDVKYVSTVILGAPWCSLLTKFEIDTHDQEMVRMEVQVTISWGPLVFFSIRLERKKISIIRLNMQLKTDKDIISLDCQTK